MKPRIGVVLSGCGVMDGSEIHEATLTLYFLDKHGAEIACFAPDKEQSDVVDHTKGKAVAETRNVLRESARIARGQVSDIAAAKADDVDAVILPGGFGAAKNLSTFAKDGAGCTVDAGVSKLLKAVHAQGKPVGALCIAPALVAALFGSEHIDLTIGTDPGTASAIEQMGARHVSARPDEIVVDAKNKIVSTPCYMTARSISEVGAGIEKAVLKVIELARG
jgi:enhancing lycopene biosynthesis protein 2